MQAKQSPAEEAGGTQGKQEAQCKQRWAVCHGTLQPAQKTGKTEEHPTPLSLKLESNKQTFCEENTDVIYLQNTSNAECTHLSFPVKTSICSTDLHIVNRNPQSQHQRGSRVLFLLPVYQYFTVCRTVEIYLQEIYLWSTWKALSQTSLNGSHCNYCSISVLFLPWQVQNLTGKTGILSWPCLGHCTTIVQIPE